MDYRGSVDGLTPGARYAATVRTEIATDTPRGCFGVGGSPGESVWIKAGVSVEEPIPVIDGAHLRMKYRHREPVEQRHPGRCAR